MKKIFLLLLLLCTAAEARLQDNRLLHRKAEQRNAGEFTIHYTAAADSLKGFFLITDNISGKVKLLQASCKTPYRFSNGCLQLSGEKIPPGFTASFTFKMLENTVKLSGYFRAENFGSQQIETAFAEISFEKPELQLAAAGPTPKNTSSNDMHTEAPASHHTTVKLPGTSTAGHGITDTVKPAPETIHPISFRVQLAASTIPMDKQKIRKLSGLDLPVYEDRIDGYYKYTIGNETALGDAQNLLNKVTKANFKKPFIVAYREQNRITVQQALAEINRK